MRSRSRLCLAAVLIAGMLPLLHAQDAKKGAKRMAFPTIRPKAASFPRPSRDEVLDISPPGFCWWRAADRGKAQYRVKVMNKAGEVVHESPALDNPVHVPEKVLPAGKYTWIVEALDKDGTVCATREPWGFAIAEGAVEQPWIPAEQILARVPKDHPRLLFPKASLDEVRATLETTRKEAFQALKRTADRCLKMTPPPEPDYDEIENKAERRMAYMRSFAEMRKYHTRGMLHLALMYALTGDKKYGEVSKALLLGAAEWDPEGISSVLARHGDEVGLGLAKAGAQTYDWIYDLLTDEERAKAKKMLIARADQMLRRLERRDWLARPESSHDGRLPGYLIEHAIALAEEPRAKVWMEYAMLTYMTLFPHWAGRDGGWAEGIPYGMAYNTIYLMPFEGLRSATGFDLWQRPFYRKVRYFFLYNISPRGEIMPWGDTEQAAVPPRTGGLRALLQFHALRHNDPVVKAWVDLLERKPGRKASISPLAGIILPDDLEPKPLTDLPNDAAFFGVGWAALHSNLDDPDDDLLVLFKSSPFGGVSHSHADQNSFAIMKGGKALAIPGGERWPTHGSPFHKKYTQQTLAHNAVLVNGEGQINRDAHANGHLTEFVTKPSFGYVCGDAQSAYRKVLTRCRRHVLLVRPSLICVVDDLEAPEPAAIQWLLHTREELELDEAAQTFVSPRQDVAMKVHLITDGGFAYAQTKEWPMDPKEGFPKTRKKPPEKHWHFTATTRETSAKHRIAAVMVVGEKGRLPPCEVRRAGDVVEVRTKCTDGEAFVKIDLSVDKVGADPVLEVRCQLKDGKTEDLSVK